MDGPHTKIRPLNELVIPVETSFDGFVMKHGGQLVRDLVGNVNPTRNADYVFQSPSIIAELKCMERPALTEEDSKRLNDLAAGWMHLGLIPRFYGTRQLRLRDVPVTCQRDWLKVLMAPWKKKLGLANKQIRQTKATLKMPNARGILFLVNDAPSWVSPHDAFNLMTRVLRSKKDTGEHVYSHLDCIVYFSINARVIQDGKGWNFWHPGFRAKNDPVVSNFVNELRNAWFQYHGNLLNMEKEIFLVPSGTEGPL
jgi:hypothetical protein